MSLADMHELHRPIVESIELDLRLVAQVRNDVATELSAIRRLEAVGEELDEADEEARAQSVIWDHLDRLARRRSLNNEPTLTPSVEEAVSRRVKADLFGLGGFEEFLFDPTVENVFVIGFDRVFVNRAGRHESNMVRPVAESDEAVIQLINRWASRLGRTERRFDVVQPSPRPTASGGLRCTPSWK